MKYTQNEIDIEGLLFITLKYDVLLIVVCKRVKLNEKLKLMDIRLMDLLSGNGFDRKYKSRKSR